MTQTKRYFIATTSTGVVVFRSSETRDYEYCIAYSYGGCASWSGDIDNASRRASKLRNSPYLGGERVEIIKAQEVDAKTFRAMQKAAKAPAVETPAVAETAVSEVAEVAAPAADDSAPSLEHVKATLAKWDAEAGAIWDAAEERQTQARKGHKARKASKPKYDCDFQGRIFSVDSQKAIKAQGFGYLNAILYMAPATQGGVGNLCSHASPACIRLCLGWESGQASMVAHDEDLNSVRLSRIAKSQAFMRDRVRMMRRIAVAIAETVSQSRKLMLKPCVRLNGSADIAWEGIAVEIDAATTAAIAKHGLTVVEGRFRNLMEVFPGVQFVDYTKNPFRMRRALPANYHLTFSRMENNEAQAIDVLRNGGNVAVVFDYNPKKGETLPSMWNGFPVIDGDTHDLRHLDPRGVVVGLSPKGRKAKRDTSGFVVRDFVAAPLAIAA